MSSSAVMGCGASPRCLSVQRCDPALAGSRASGARVRHVPDPRLHLTAQELIYAASALRAEARRAERQAADSQFESSRTIFERAARAYDELAGKFTRIAERVQK